eukprot:1973017-Alexandrium_andersonii.AAC.1
MRASGPRSRLLWRLRQGAARPRTGACVPHRLLLPKGRAEHGQDGGRRHHSDRPRPHSPSGRGADLG